MKDILTHIGIAEHYLRNCQFENAAQAYEGAVGCLYDASDMSDLRALEGVSSVNTVIRSMDGTIRAVAGQQSPLHDALVSTYGRESLEGLDHFVGFQCPGTEYWVVSYHAREQLVLDDCSVASGCPRAFTLVSTETGVAAWHLPNVVRAQLSYLLAHIAWARVEVATLLYSQHQIMSDSGTQALLAAAQRLHHAIALRPENSWSYARLGETYRRIANGWLGDGYSIFHSEPRVRDYVVALLYYERALSLAPDAAGAFWVHAHLGAAIVNVRAFAGVARKPDSPALNALLAAWRPKSEPHEAYRWLLRKAQDSLIEGQRRAGYYYPWAEDYYSGALLLEGISVNDGNGESDLTIFGFMNAINSLYLQPMILNQVFEPGELYVSPFLQWGLFVFWLGSDQARPADRARQFGRAWAFTRSGMARLFKFRFLPGVQALQGFQLLINIAAEASKLVAEISDPDDIEFVQLRVLDLMDSELGVDFSVGGVKIPRDTISSQKDLVVFIQAVLARIGVPTITQVTPDKTLNSNLKMSLVQAYFVFMDYHRILRTLDRIDVKEALASKQEAEALASELMNTIATKLGFVPTNALTPLYSAEDHKEDLAGTILTGKVTYRMSSHINIIMGTSTEG